MLGIKKILLGAFFSLLLSFSFLIVGTVSPAQATPTNTNTTAAASSGDSTPILGGINDLKNTLSNIANNFTSGLGSLVTNILKGIFTALGQAIGGDGAAPPSGSAYLDTPRTADEAYARYGVLGAIGSGVQEMYDNPPITTTEYLATIHPVGLAQAVSGSDVLESQGSPIFIFWQISRNLAYIFFVVILTTIGLMIMFRSKIDPRTTVSVTAALPGLVVSLVLITFSLAFAAFIIDIGRVLMAMAQNIINSANFSSNILPMKDSDLLTTGGIWKTFVLNWEAPSFGGFGGALAGAIVWFIILVFTLIIGIELFITLLVRYINLLIKPIFAPFIFLFAALPGRGGSIASWFKGYFVDAATFAGVFMVLLIAEAFRNSGHGATVVGQDPFGLFLGNSNINAIISLYIMFLATKVPAILEEAFDVKPSGHVEKSGSQPSSMIKRVPIINNFIK